MQTLKVNRRQFLKKAAFVVGGTVVACSGITAVGLFRNPVDFPSYLASVEDQPRVLVTYASLFGSTAEIAQEIAKVLQDRNLAVDLIPVKEVSDISSYQSVVLGSAIRMSKWMPDALNFVTKFQSELRIKSTAFFTVCLTLRDDTVENRESVQAYSDPVRALVQPKKEGFFAGKLNYQSLNLAERLLMKGMNKAPEGDFRNWDLIRAWAGELFI